MMDTKKNTSIKRRHPSKEVTRAASQFFAVRNLIRSRFARGTAMRASAWLRFEVLKFIESHDAPRVTDVAGYLSVTTPSATSLVAGLVRDGLVTRHADIRDRRISRLALSKRGEQTLTDTITRGTKIVNELFAPLSAHELKTFIRFLERILNAHKP